MLKRISTKMCILLFLLFLICFWIIYFLFYKPGPRLKHFFRSQDVKYFFKLNVLPKWLEFLCIFKITLLYFRCVCVFDLSVPTFRYRNMYYFQGWCLQFSLMNVSFSKLFTKFFMNYFILFFYKKKMRKKIFNSGFKVFFNH